MSLKDKLDQEPVRAEAWRPDAGQELIGRITRINDREQDGRDPYPVVTVEEPDGSLIAFHAFHTVAKNQLLEAGAQAGDEIAIRYLGKKEDAARPYHNYRIVVEHAANGAPADDEVPF
ncbi:MAG TPA: hypothetical protein VMT20_07245 [Terriglobia bacterium]|nr:hypothetical protein [Terriglobia bacterium]